MYGVLRLHINNSIIGKNKKTYEIIVYADLGHTLNKNKKYLISGSGPDPDKP